MIIISCDLFPFAAINGSAPIEIGATEKKLRRRSKPFVSPKYSPNACGNAAANEHCGQALERYATPR